MGGPIGAPFSGYDAPPGTTPELPDDSINVPLLAGLLSGLGTLFLGILCVILWFAVAGEGRIQLGDIGEPGTFDDEQAFLEEEEEALELMDEQSRQMYLEAKGWIDANPPNSVNTDISLSQYMTIQEKAVHAWEFEVDVMNQNCFVEQRTEIEFFDAVGCVQTNLPVPKQNDVYYWEAKIYDKPQDTTVSVGLTTKPYPQFRLPGLHRYSIAYDSTGIRRVNQPFRAPQYGPPLQPGDVVGCGYRTRTGTVFFTRNGKKLEDVAHGVRMNMFPTIGATGPATVVVNFGQAGFVYIEANVKKWGLAPAHGSLAPPPPYGAERDSVLLQAADPRGAGPAAASATAGEASGGRPPPPFASDSAEDEGRETPGGVISLARLSGRRKPTASQAVPRGQPSHQLMIAGSPPPRYSEDPEQDPARAPDPPSQS